MSGQNKRTVVQAKGDMFSSNCDMRLVGCLVTFLSIYIIKPYLEKSPVHLHENLAEASLYSIKILLKIKGYMNKHTSGDARLYTYMVGFQ